MKIFLFLVLALCSFISAGWTDDGSKLQEAIDLIRTNPIEADKQLEKLDYPTAWAFQAYIRFAASGPSEEVDALMKKATKGESSLESGNDGLFENGHYIDMYQVLRDLRFIVTRDEAATDISIPCFVFQNHPRGAYRAFDGYWGSSMDAFPYLCELPEVKRPKYDGLVNAISASCKGNEETGTIRSFYWRISLIRYLKLMLSPEVSLAEVGITPRAQTSVFAQGEAFEEAAKELVTEFLAQYPDVNPDVITRNTREALIADIDAAAGCGSGDY